jgi:ABC-type bacteriocin/lantibiotic exporter with double-glycine peptidase domain
MSPSQVALHAVVGHVARRQGLAVDDDDLAVRIAAIVGDDAAVDVDVVIAACTAAGLEARALRMGARKLRATAARLGPVILLRDHRPVGVVVGVTGVLRKDVLVRRLHGSVAGAPELMSLPALRSLCGVDSAADTDDGQDLNVVLTEHASKIELGHHSAHPFERLRQLLRLERRDVGVVGVYAAVIAFLSLATPLAVSALVSSIAFSNLLQPLVVLSILLAAALVASGVIRTMQLAVVEMLQRRLFVRLVADLAWRLPRISEDERRGRDPSKLVNRFFDVVTAQKVLPTLLIEGTTLVLELVIGLTILAFYSPLLLAFSIGLMGSIAFIIFVLGRGGIGSSIDESYAKHDVAGWLEELVRTPSVFRATSARRFGARRVDEAARAYLDARRRHFRVLLRQAVGAFAVQATTAVLLLAVGGVLVIDGTLTLGQLVAAELIVGAVTQGLIKLHKQLESAYDLLAALDKLGALVEVDIEADDVIADGDSLLLPLGPLSVRAESVVVGDRGPHSYSCGAGDAIAVSSAISDTIGVLVGAVVHSAGRVTVGDIDIGVVARSALRDRVTVAGDVELIEGTLGENLRMGRNTPGTADVVAALTLVELDGEFLAHGDGLKTHLVPGNPSLTASVGRRLMLARAILSSPGVLVVDGALDVLEVGLRQRILARLRALPCTLILITEAPDLKAALTPAPPPAAPPPPPPPPSPSPPPSPAPKSSSSPDASSSSPPPSPSPSPSSGSGRTQKRRSRP